MKSRRTLVAGLVTLILVVIVAVGAVFWTRKSGDDHSRGFAACVKAGNPVMESYPRQCRNAKGELFAESVSGATFKSKHGVSLLVSSPHANAVVSNPVEVKGKVPGTWTFEANFGLELLDANRKSVATSYASVEGNWMTKKDVIFTGVVPFKPPSTKTGFLVLHKANPSDTEGDADSAEIPIRFR